MQNFKLYPVKDIWFNEDERQRKDLGDLSDLQQSIGELGLLNPVIITSEGKLIAGERRLTCFKALNIAQIPVHYKEDCSTTELAKIELDENIKRLDLDWRDRAAAILSYHNLCKQEDDNWSIAQTAESMGYKKTHIADNIKVATEIKEGNLAVIDAPRFSTASNIIRRKTSRAAASEAELLVVMEEAPAAITMEEAKEVVKKKKKKIPLLNTDFIKWAASYKEKKFNFIHCDFPYGVNANKHDAGAAKEFGGYEDSIDVYYNLLLALANSMENVIADSAHLLFWFSPTYYNITFTRLAEMGWRVNPHPLIWHRNNNSGIMPDPQRGPRQVYEMAFMASRGDRLVVKPISNHTAAPNTKEIHMSEKPMPMLEYFCSMFVDESTVMLDPTCGSGNAVKTSIALGAASSLGIEMNQAFYKNAVDNWDK